jgi:Kef-type K+ transport system membrane component KefB
VRDALEAIKTAVVWLVVVQILTILSPLLNVPLKWALIVGVALSLSSFTIGLYAYLKARRTQRGLPE